MAYSNFKKRTFDLFFCSLSILFLSPVFILTAFLIKLFDSGPILFKQKRIGRNGAEFLFYKFRSMPVGTKNIPSDIINKVEITWVGKFIRRLNIDELPQLINILKGEMSIVGPRPSLPSQTDLNYLRKKNNSFKCIPGLTGLAQVNSFDGMTVNEKAKLDGEYYKKKSVIFDIKIILKTFLYVLKPPPKY